MYFVFVRSDELLRCKACAVSKYCSRGCQASKYLSLTNKLIMWIIVDYSGSVLWHCWLGVRKSIQPVKKWVMRCLLGYLSGVKCIWFVYGPVDVTATRSSLKSDWFNFSGASLPRLSWKRGS